MDRLLPQEHNRQDRAVAMGLIHELMGTVEDLGHCNYALVFPITSGRRAAITDTTGDGLPLAATDPVVLGYLDMDGDELPELQRQHPTLIDALTHLQLEAIMAAPLHLPAGLETLLALPGEV